MSKFGTFGEYPSQSLATAEKALLTAWRSLERYHDDLVLVGPAAAVAAFHTEAGAANTGYEFALQALRRDFSEPALDGPLRAAESYPGSTGNRDRIREDLATVGRLLLGL